MAEKISLSKKFRFESAHRLAKGYVGKCNNIHGHSWNGSLTVSTKELDKFGMGVDYGVLGTILKVIENELDHKIILCEEDEELIALCEKQGWAVVKFAENPTSEAIAMWIYDTVEQYFLSDERFSHVTVESVVVEETCTTACTITK